MAELLMIQQIYCPGPISEPLPQMSR